MTKKHESEKAAMVSEHTKDMKRTTNELKDELMRMSKTAKLEKDNLISHYERRMQELKNLYDIEKIKESDEKKNEPMA